MFRVPLPLCPPQSSPESPRSEDIAKAITAKRKRMREFSRRQIERLGAIETQLSATLEQITDELARDRHTATHSQQQFSEQIRNETVALRRVVVEQKLANLPR